MTSIDRTAYPTFGRMVTSRELQDLLTPSAGEIEWARDSTATDSHLLALTVWLKSHQRLGYFPKLDEVPGIVVDHIRDVLELPAGVAPEAGAARTAKRHRNLVRRRLGVKYDAAAACAFAEEAIQDAAQTKDNPADLINVALDVLISKSCELPGYTTLDLAAKTIRARVNRDFFAAAAARITPAQRAVLERLMVVDPATRRSGFDRLKDPALAASLGKFRQRLVYLAELDALGPTEVWLEGIPPGKIGNFAGEARVTSVEDFRRVKDARRLTLLACLIHVLRVAARDEVTDMFCKRMAVIHRKGRDRLEELRELHRAESERLLEVFGDVLAAARDAAAPGEAGESAGDDAAGDLAQGAAAASADGEAAGEPAAGSGRAGDLEARTGRLVLETLDAAGGLERLAAAYESVAAYHGNNYLPLLEAFYRSHRAALFTLVDSIELEATSEDRAVLDALEFVRAVRHLRGEWIGQSVTVMRGEEKAEVSIDIAAFASEMWKRALRDKGYSQDKPETRSRKRFPW